MNYFFKRPIQFKGECILKESPKPHSLKMRLSVIFGIGSLIIITIF